MAHTTEANKETFLQALEEQGGNVSKAATACGIPRITHYKWLEADPEYKEAVRFVQEATIDHVENKLMDCINGGKEASIIFFLKTRAKHRGYVEKQEIDHTTGGKPIMPPPPQIIILGAGSSSDTADRQ